MPVRDFLRRTLKKGKVGLSRLQVKLQPDRPQSNRQLAQALVDRGDWDAAIDQCHRTLRFTPDDPWTYKALAEAHNGKGEFDAALDAIQQAIGLDPHQGYFHYTLARIHIQQAQWSEAIAAGRQAIELDQQVSWFHYQLGETLVKSGNWPAAIPPLERAIEMHPLFAWSYFYLAEAYLALEQPQQAIDLYRRALKFNPDIDYIRQSLNYAQQLTEQEQRIQDFVQAAQAEDRQLAAAGAAVGSDRPLRVLLVAPYPTYPPKLGGITRMFYEMKSLGSRFTLAVSCFIFTKEDYRLETDLGRYCQLPLTVMNGDSPPQPRGMPHLIHRYSSLRMRKVLQALSAANFDIVVFDMIYMAQYRDLFPNAFHVLSEQNIESQLLRSCSQVSDPKQLQQMTQQQSSVQAFVGAETEADLLADYENEQWPLFPLRWVVSELDQADLDRRCSTGKTVIVRNGVDTQGVQVQADQANNRILFIGTLSYYPNIDGANYFTEAILPHIWQQDPTVEFWIAGSAPPQSILDLGQHPKIRVIANPDDMTEVARQCSVTVVPLRIGSGTRIKILQAFGMGLPVITTSLGCAGLDVSDRHHLLIQDDPEAFAQATLELLGDRDLRERFRQNGRELVEQAYDWDQIYQMAVTNLATEFQAWATRRSSVPLSQMNLESFGVATLNSNEICPSIQHSDSQSVDPNMHPIVAKLKTGVQFLTAHSSHSQDSHSQDSHSQDSHSQDSHSQDSQAMPDHQALILNWALQQVQQELYYPQAYLTLIQECLQPKTIEVKQLHENSQPERPASRRFATLVSALKNLPAIDFPTAQTAALIADRFRHDRTTVESASWIGDVGTHFELSSSFGLKGRILSTIVRYAQSRRGIELGTAYGMSALFILEMMKTQGRDFHLATLEGSEPQFTLASTLLKERYGDRVSCYYGWTQDIVPEIVNGLENVDFMFHDAGHSKKDYVRDFNAILPILAPGAIVIIDDITWNDPRFCSEDPKTYEGWLEVASHPRVLEAVEVDYGLGLLLLS